MSFRRYRHKVKRFFRHRWVLIMALVAFAVLAYLFARWLISITGGFPTDPPEGA